MNTLLVELLLMTYTLPELPYDFSALEPHIDTKTMHIHHGKHHATYVAKLNEVLAKYEVLQSRELIDLISNLDSLDIPDSDKTALRNNGGGHLNHSLYWTLMGPEKTIDEVLSSRIKSTFGSLESFKQEMQAGGLARFGSGWVWLVENAQKELKIYSTSNQDSPYMTGDTPLIGIDVWEHAYYLKYQNLRADYLSAWWSVCKVIE